MQSQACGGQEKKITLNVASPFFDVQANPGVNNSEQQMNSEQQ